MTAPGLVVPGPGVYPDLPESVYHRDPVPGGSLSFSGAKRLLPPGCPAKFRHEQLNGRPHKAVYDAGHAIHALVLGVGAELVVVEADDWRGKDAQQQRKEARDAGFVPLLAADYAKAKGAADAVLADPLAGLLFKQGQPEVSLFWNDERWDVMRRGRVDWLSTLASGRPVAVDLKSCVSAEPRAIAKAVGSYRYDVQHATYTQGLAALTGEEHTFLFVFVETEPPHIVTVCELDDEAVETGRALNDRAVALYADCAANDHWPSYASDVVSISLPRWAVTSAYGDAA